MLTVGSPSPPSSCWDHHHRAALLGRQNSPLGKNLSSPTRVWRKNAASAWHTKKKLPITVRLTSGKLFTGEQFDPNLGFYYLRARYYNPSVGRFPNMDTFQGMVHQPFSLHKYTYVQNNPANWLDPSGNITLGSLGASIAIIGTLTTISNVGITYLGSVAASHDEDGLPDAAIFTLGGSAGTGGAMAEAGGDIIADLRTGKVWAYGFIGVGLSPISLFKRFKSAGATTAVGLVWNFNDPNEWSGFSVGANWPLSILPLLPASAFRSNKMWGAMTQLARRQRNVRSRDLTAQIGVSTAGPVALKVAHRSNAFSSSVGFASSPFEIPAGGYLERAKELARDFGGAISEVL